MSATQAAGEGIARAAAAAAFASAVKLEARLAGAQEALRAAEAKHSAARSAAAAAEGVASELRERLAEAEAALSASKTDQVRPRLSSWSAPRFLNWLTVAPARQDSACHGWMRTAMRSWF